MERKQHLSFGTAIKPAFFALLFLLISTAAISNVWAEDNSFRSPDPNRPVGVAAAHHHAGSFRDVQVYGDYFYWLDPKAKAIYRLKRPTFSPTPPRVSSQILEPETLWSGLPLKSPVGITVDGSGVMYVIDDEVEGIFSLTPKEPIKLLYTGAPLHEPTAIAAVAGRLYIVDDETDQLYNFDLARKKLTSEYTFDGETPDRLLAEGAELLAFHEKSRVLHRFAITKMTRADVGKSETEREARIDSTTLGLGEKVNLSKVLDDVTDLCFSNGIVYFIDEESSRLVLLPPGGSEPSSLPLSLLSDHPVALAATADALYFVEGNSFRIRKQPSLQPVTLAFVGREWTTRKIVEFYRDLNSKLLLPTKPIEVANATTLDVLISELQLLPTGYVDDFQVLFCELNVSVCSGAQRKVPPPSAPTPEEYPVRLSKGQSIILPDLQITASIKPGNLKLPLDPKFYNPDFFGDLFSKPLRIVAPALAPKGLAADKLMELIKSYNPDYKGSDIFAETEGSFSIPLQVAKLTAVVPRSDLLDQNSLIHELAEKKNIIGSSPMFQLKQYATRSQRFETVSKPTYSSRQPDPCLPDDPALRSAAMDLIKYCEPSSLPTAPDVAIIDYDFNPNHPAFTTSTGTPALEVFRKPNSQIEREPLDSPSRTTFDERVDHGTHIAAIIGARPQPGTMVGLLPNARLYGLPVKDLDEALSAWEFLRLFNVSLGETGATGGELSGTEELEDIFTTQRLRLFVLAAGNDNKKVPKSSIAGLGYLDNVIVVGATNVPEVDPATNQRPPRTVWTLPDGKGSNRHPLNVGLMAPGEKIKSALRNGQYGVAAGTSEAAPFVTAAAAALMAIEPHWVAWQLKFRLVATADLWTSGPSSDAVFAGELNFNRALSDTKTVVLERQPPARTCRGQFEKASLNRNLVIKQQGDTFTIPWDKILRITRDSPTATKYTIIYYEEHYADLYPDRYNHYLHRLTAVTTAELKENFTFNFVSTDPSTCSGAVSIVDLIDFVNKGPGSSP
jgi:hypothetical protein